jgi:hypothetical protein
LRWLRPPPPVSLPRLLPLPQKPLLFLERLDPFKHVARRPPLGSRRGRAAEHIAEHEPADHGGGGQWFCVRAPGSR